MNITYLIKYLWKKKWIIILPTLIAVVAAGFYSLRMAKSYSSLAELSTGFMEINPLGDNRSPNNAALFNNVIQTLQSKQVLDQVTYSLLLHDLTTNAPYRNLTNKEKVRFSQLENRYRGGKAGLLVSLNNKADSFYVLDLAKEDDRQIGEMARLYGYTTEFIQGNLEVKKIEGSDFIDITAQTENPNLSAAIANAVCRTFLQFYQSRQDRAAAYSLDTLKGIMDTKKQILDNKVKMLQGENNFSGTTADGLLATLQGQLSSQKTALIQARASLDNINQQLAGTTGKQGSLANNEDIIALRGNIDTLYAKYVNGGSSDAGLLDQITKLRGTLQQKLSAENNTSAGGMSTADLQKQKMTYEVTVNAANQTIKELQDKITELTSSARSSASRAGVVQELQNEIEIARQEYTNASTVYNNALNRNIFPGNNFKQALVASPALGPNPSKKAKTIGLSGAAVFFLIVFLLLFIEFINPGIKAPSFLKENMPLPLLANLERISLKHPAVEGIFSANGSLPQHKNGFREQMKQLRYEVENSGKRVFLVSSYFPRSGATTLIRGLASSLSLKNKKVLLIDANFQHNSLSQQYKAHVFIESFDASIGNVDPVRKLAEVLTATEDENIKLIGCQHGTHTPEEILPAANVFSFLKANAMGYDYIFIDCASLSKGPDCKELLRYVDAVILLFAANQRLNDESRDFAAFLKKNNIHTLGMVLNKIHSYNMDL